MSFTISVPGHWKHGIHERPATVHGSDADGGPDGLPVVVARGVARLARTGEPLSVDIEGWRPVDGDWDKLHNSGAGEWVCAAERVDQA